jgi:hypothetical protein
LTVLTGTLGHEDVNSSKQVRDVSKRLHYKYMDLGPLTALLMKMPQGRKAINPKVEWLRNDKLPRWDGIASVAGASGATITVTPDNVSYFKVGDIVEVADLSYTSVQTNIGVVTTKTTSIVITAVGWQSNLAASAATFPTVSAGMRLHIISDASEEYSQSPAMKVNQVENEWNNIGFKRAPFVVGNIQGDQENYSGPERKQRKKETHDDIRIQFEEDLFHGERYYRDGTNGRQFFMRGFKRFLRQAGGVNVWQYNGTFTEAQLDEALLKGPCRASIGSKRRFWFMGDDLYLKVLAIGKAKERIIGQKEILGQNFMIYLAPGGIKIYMTVHHLMTDVYSGSGLMIDPKRARIRPYGKQGVFRYLESIQENDRAGMKDEWQIIASLEVDRVDPHMWVEDKAA